MINARYEVDTKWIRSGYEVDTKWNMSMNFLFKNHIDNIPHDLNSKKDIEDYCKKFWKEHKEIINNKKNIKAKRQLSAYNIYVKEKYEEVKIKYPNMKNTDVLVTLAKMWQTQKEINKIKLEYYVEEEVPSSSEE